MDNYEHFYLINKNNNNIYNNLVIDNQINRNNIVLDLEKHNIKLRIYYFDILRIVSSFSVILIHVSARYYKLNINSNILIPF